MQKSRTPKEKALQDYFHDHTTLIVYDNLWDSTLASSLLRVSLGCPVIITSRKLMVRQQLGGVIQLNGLKRKDAVTLFCKISNAKASPAVGAICRLLVNHPLAIRIAAARIPDEGEKPAWLLGRLRQGSPLAALHQVTEEPEGGVTLSLDPLLSKLAFES